MFISSTGNFIEAASSMHLIILQNTLSSHVSLVVLKFDNPYIIKKALIWDHNCNRCLEIFSPKITTCLDALTFSKLKGYSSF
jgi:hypothetical protein